VRALASRAGISAAYVTSIELGVNPTTGRPPVPSIQVVRRLATALGIDVPRLLDESDPGRDAPDDHVLLYCLEQPPFGMLEAIERTFGSGVDHWLYVADPREPEVDGLDGRATVVRWELGAFPYATSYLDPDAVLTALDGAVCSLSTPQPGYRVGLATADSSAVMRWVQNATAEVTLERTWHTHVHDSWMRHLGTSVAIDVCVYQHEDKQALGLTIDQLGTALALIRAHHRVFVLDHRGTIDGPLAIRRMLERTRPAGVSKKAWGILTDAAAETLATRGASPAAE
jgi:transcriptional regulator with XRE-family HTH domain